MATKTTTSTYTSISGPDVRTVINLFGREATAIAKAACVALDFSVDDALVDIGILALNAVITAVRLEFYRGDTLLIEYRYRIVTGPRESSPASTSGPPLASVPANTRLRLTVEPNVDLAEAEADQWFCRLGWIEGVPLKRPDGAKYQAFGVVFASGGFAMERQVWIHPRFDSAIRRGATGRWRPGESSAANGRHK